MSVCEGVGVGVCSKDPLRPPPEHWEALQLTLSHETRMPETAGGGRCPAPRPPAGRACPQLLGSAMAATAVLSYFGPHFAVISSVSTDRTTYEALHHWGEWGGGRPLLGRGLQEQRRLGRSPGLG